MRIEIYVTILFIVGGLVAGEIIVVRAHTAPSAKSNTLPTHPKVAPGNAEKERLPRVIFLNQSAVLIASKKHKENYKEHQARLIEMMNKGVTVLVCPDCMKQYDVKASDLIDGVQVGKPSQTQES
jgi:sulfur relay (sulfurtransferase) complex TusBCD TusD component (DsrE family)